ncbi:MAG: hypothetical protein JRJ15_13460 [Deltaproteobacteria bacterium]|nr:hypothetical protein [Deltaproteobacteria bacterium]
MLGFAVDCQTREGIDDVAVRIEAKSRHQNKVTLGVVCHEPDSLRPFPGAGHGVIEGGCDLVA